jgi:DNA-binding transcriptional MerR regulator/methylmalonyl-CoA mutase cobalamin-binding subunit
MNSLNTEARHPVRVVSRRTGLTPATLRAWERRYGAVKPLRSDGGQRLYSDVDIERLTILRELTDRGRSIGLVADLSTTDASSLLAEDRRATPASHDPVEADTFTAGTADLVAEGLRLAVVMDGEGLQALMRRSAVALGATAFLDRVVAPFLHAIGDGWTKSEIGPAQEHLASEIVESVLSWLAAPAMDAAEGPVLVVGTLPGEQHRLGARLVAAVAAFEGWQVRYLGVDLPGAELARGAKLVGAKVVALSAVGGAATPEAVEALKEMRAGLAPEVRVILGGRSASDLYSKVRLPGVAVIQDLNGLRVELRGAA